MATITTVSSTLITQGSWTSQTLDRNLGQFPTASYNNFWGKVSFEYEAGDTSSDVKLDILDSSSNELLTDVALIQKNRRKEADLSVLPTVRNTNIKIRFRLRAVSKSPVIKDIQVFFQDTINA